MEFDFYSCPYEPDTGPVPCGQRPECAVCSWLRFSVSVPHNEKMLESQIN